MGAGGGGGGGGGGGARGGGGGGERIGALGGGGVGTLWKVVESASSMGFERASGDEPLEDEASEEEEGGLEEGEGAGVDENERVRVGGARDGSSAASACDHTVDNVRGSSTRSSLRRTARSSTSCA